MKLVFFAHPSFLGSQSMGRFAAMLSKGMEERGHQVEVWAPKAFFFQIALPHFIRKWLGYIDEYIVFRFTVHKRLKQCTTNTIFVFTDQALGPWVPWINNRPHVIHCHDFLAQRSALGQIKENPTKWFGRQYQAYIRKGYLHGRNFISVSKKTQTDLHEFLLETPWLSEVVYNGLNQPFLPGDKEKARVLLATETGIDLSKGYILHTGGNQWYKNRVGVIEIYNACRLKNYTNLPLVLIGQKPGSILFEAYQNSPFKTDIHFLYNIGDALVRTAYSGASVFIFPSLAEGFGWPIAEAMASGCPVITTGETPMTEVAGDAGFFIPRMPDNKDEIEAWAIEAAKVVNKLVKLTFEEQEGVIAAGLENVKRFNLDYAMSTIEGIYKKVELDYD